MQRITPKGARFVSRDLDKLASLIENEATTLGIPPHIAADAVHKFDALADHIERQAGLTPQMKKALDGLDVHKEQGFDPETIGEEVSGPLEGDSDEPYMKGEFTQQENRELREEQEAGALPKGTDEPQAPRAGVQAAFKGLISALKSSKLQGRQAAAVTRALKLATTVVMAEDKEEKDEEVPAFLKDKEEKKEGKKAGEVPEAFKKQWDKGEDKEDEKEEKKDGKKASHGYNLFAR